MPNPNLTAPPFVDGNPLPAVGLNRLASFASTSLNILSYGASGDGVTDNTSAWNAATGALSGDGCIYFPPGLYKFSNPLVYNFPADKVSITVRGEGQDITELIWPTTVGTALSFSFFGFGNSLHMRDMTLSTSTVNQDVGLRLIQTAFATGADFISDAPSDITRVSFRSSEGYSVPTSATITNFGWKTAVDVRLVSSIIFDSLSVNGISNGNVSGYAATNAGVGITVTGNPQLTVGGFAFSKCTFSSLATGLLFNAYTVWASLTQNHFAGNNVGIAVLPGASGIGQLTVSESKFRNVTGLALYSSLSYLSITNNIFAQNGSLSTVSILYQAPSLGTLISGNTFHPYIAGTVGGTGIILNNTGSTVDTVPSVIHGNTFVSGANSVTLGTNTSGVSLYGNTHRFNTTNIVNNGTGNTIRLQTFTTTNVTSATNNGSGNIRLTVASTTGFFTGVVCAINDVSGIPHVNSVYPITFVDSTHIDLPVAFSGSYSAATCGTVSNLV